MSILKDHFDVIAALPETEQIRMAQRLRAESDQLRARFMATEEYQMVNAARAAGEPEIDKDKVSEATRALMSAFRHAEDEAQQMECHLFATTRRDDVRDATRASVDMVIAGMPVLTDEDEETLSAAHAVLYLSAFGGRLGPAGWGQEADYIFNTVEPSSTSFQMIESLRDSELVGTIEPTTGNNLTVLGKAVLKRLNEMRGPSIPENEMDERPSSSSRPAVAPRKDFC